jgi:hypothetical protein
MRNIDMKQKQVESNIKNDDTKQDQNVLKVGYFQLQTKSFWISLVSILCLFLLAVIWTNIITYNRMIEKFLSHEEKILEIIHSIPKK